MRRGLPKKYKGTSLKKGKIYTFTLAIKASCKPRLGIEQKPVFGEINYQPVLGKSAKLDVVRAILTVVF